MIASLRLRPEGGASGFHQSQTHREVETESHGSQIASFDSCDWFFLVIP